MRDNAPTDVVEAWMKEKELSFVQVVIGEYTYRDKEGNQELSHAIYGLNKFGRVYKYIPMKKMWIYLEELDFN